MNVIWKLRGYIKMYVRQYLVPSWLIGRIVDRISDGELTLTV
ncbi:hypothetical protein [Photobacterium pectinilyticum]|nr:hypothetical protein [Photobacterium sp. ZSDE20]